MSFIEIDGIIEFNDEISHEEFWDKFIEWVEDMGGLFGGVTKPYTEVEE